MKKLLLASTLAASVVVLLSLGTSSDTLSPSPLVGRALATATFAGGCFWCVESDFEAVPGVVEAISGYTGGQFDNPTYEEVSSGITGHRESVKVRFDPRIISYQGLLEAFWRMVNPTDAGGQFADRGEEYSPAIFYHTEAQRVAAEQSAATLNASGRYPKPVRTPILPAMRFYMAEDYHQDYYKRNPLQYKFFRSLSGRDRYLEKTWGTELQIGYGSFSDITPYRKPTEEEGYGHYLDLFKRDGTQSVHRMGSGAQLKVAKFC